MIKSLKDLIKDEKGMATLQACIHIALMPCAAGIAEAILCINPLSWICCLPCIFAIGAPLALFGGVIGTICAGVILDTTCLPCEILGISLSLLAVLSGAITPKELINSIIQFVC